MSNSISGNAGVAGAYVTAISSDLATTVVNAFADSSGNYTLSGLSAGTYFVSPSLIGYLFGSDPGYQVVTITSSNVTGIDFTGSLFVQPNPAAWTKQGVIFTSNTHVGGLFPGAQPSSVLYEGNSQLGLGAGSVFKLYYSDGNNCEYAESLTGLPGSWTKYSSNPIIANMFYPNVYVSGGTYYLNCISAASYPITAISVYTSSTSVGPWTLQTSNALTPPSWAGSSIGDIVVMDIISGTWYALFTAQGAGPVYATAIGLCTSTNGINWTVSGSTPVIYNASSPGIRKIGSTYYVWFNYNNYDSALSTGSSLGYVLYATNTTVYRAQSTNFTTWTNFVPTMFRTTLEEGEGLGPAPSTGAPQFAEASGSSYMFYVANPSYAGPNFCAVATTPQTMASLVTGNEGTVYAGQLAQDNFLRTSYPENPISNAGGWIAVTGYSGIEVASLGVCQCSTASTTEWSIYRGVNWPANQYSEFVLLSNSSGNIYATVRTPSNNGYGYLFTLGAGTGSPATATLYAVDSGGSHSIATVSVTPYLGDTFRLSVETVGSDNVLTVTQNTIQILQFTDSVYATNLTSGTPGCAIGCGVSTSSEQISAWAAGGTGSPTPLGTYSRSITVDYTQCGTADSTNFPLLISGTYPYLATVANGGLVQNASGYDIQFSSDSAGTTLLNWEVETYSATSGAVNIWVQIPTLSHSTNTVIYMWYGNSSVSTFQGGATGATWDSTFAAVWHFPNGSSLSVLDSTSHGNNGTIVGTVTAATGQIDGALQNVTAGNNDVTVSNSASLQITSKITLSAWLNYTALASGGGNIIVQKRDATVDNPMEYGTSIGPNMSSPPKFTFQFYDGGYTTLYGNTSIPTSQWSFLAAAVDETVPQITFYYNGSPDGTPAYSSHMVSGNNPVQISNYGQFFGGIFQINGQLDEVRIANVTRSSSWILAEYNNQSTPSAFYTVGNLGTYSRTITIDHTKCGSADSTNFPFLFGGTYSYLATVANGGLVQNANGYDIQFSSDSAGMDLLSWEVETYNATTGAVNIWVKIPTVSHSTNTVIYLWYGNPDISSFQGGSTGAAWDSNYKGVWHLPNGSTLSVADSTTNANNGTNNGATATSGEIDGGAAFLGSSSQYVDLGGSSSLNIGAVDFTLEYWINSTTSVFSPVISKQEPSSPFYSWISGFGYIDSSGNPQNSGTLFMFGYAGTAQGFYTNSTHNDGTWHLFVVVRQSGAYTMYVDGVSVSITNSIGTTGSVDFTNTGDAQLGTKGAFPVYYTGSLDEPRLSTGLARSASWVLTEYNNQSSPSTFYTVGSLPSGFVPQSSVFCLL
jgi:Concanavalin A-like lectin/glucanases superfamily/Domain of unknown function (DUF2341)